MVSAGGDDQGDVSFGFCSNLCYEGLDVSSSGLIALTRSNCLYAGLISLHPGLIVLMKCEITGGGDDRSNVSRAARAEPAHRLRLPLPLLRSLP